MSSSSSSSSWINPSSSLCDHLYKIVSSDNDNVVFECVRCKDKKEMSSKNLSSFWLTDQVISDILVLLWRASLSWTEVPSYNNCVSILENIIKK